MTKKKDPKDLEKVGRPTAFDPTRIPEIINYCKLGAIDEDLAEMLEVCIATIYNWKNDHPEFLDAIKQGKELADQQVVKSLFYRANGYSHDAVHISNYKGEITETDYTKHYAPDPTSMIFWLKNRQPDLWKDKQEIGGGLAIGITEISTEEFKKARGEMLEEDDC